MQEDWQGTAAQAVPFQRNAGRLAFGMVQTLFAELPEIPQSASDSGCVDGVHEVPFQWRITLIGSITPGTSRRPTAQTSLAALPQTP